jgi:hypothetical protein
MMAGLLLKQPLKLALVQLAAGGFFLCFYCFFWVGVGVDGWMADFLGGVCRG